MDDRPMTHCPSPEELENLLSESLDADTRARLEEHVGECAECQARLERIAVDPTDWMYWEEQLHTRQLSWPDAEPTVDESLPEGWPVLEGYQILEVLGRGGMGIVYRAKHEALGRSVALKKLHGDSANDPELLRRFQREALTLAQLHHPNIVQVYEILEPEGSFLISLELVEGGNLSQRLRRETLSSEEAARMLVTLAEAIQVAHDNSIVHRDLKPANVLLTPEGIPRIADFGLARRWDTAGSTHAGRIMGTPSYVPPEQALAQEGWTKPAVDVYALGAILYECLTGRPPFRAESAMETLLQVVNDDPVPPSRLQPKTPRDLETICLKCLHKNPSRRYDSAADLGADLQRFLNNEPIQARPVTRMERLRKWCRRHPATALLLSVLLVVLVGSLSIITWKWQEAVDEKRRAEQAHQRSREDLYFGRIALAEREIASENLSRSEDLLRQCPEEMRNWEWHYIHRLTQEHTPIPRELVGHERGQWEIAFSPDGSRISTSGIDGKVRIWDSASCKLISTFEGHVPNAAERFLIRQKGEVPLPVLSAQFSPDGKKIASGAWRLEIPKLTGLIKIWDVDSGKVIHTLLGHEGMVMRTAWSPDGKLLASASMDKSVRLWNPETGKLIRTLKGHEDWVRGLKFSPDGKLLASGSVDATARIWDPHTGELRHVLKGHVASVTELDFSPDGARLITSGLDGSARQWNPQTGTQLGKPLYGHTGQVLSITFHPNGQRFATSGMDRTINVWDARPGKERVILTLRDHRDPTWSIAFSPDGNRLAAAGFDKFNARVWDGTPVTQTQPKDGWIRHVHKDLVMGVAFSPDGSQVATAGGGGVVRTWRASDGKPLQTFHLHSAAVWNVAYSPDGKLLASASRDTNVCVVDLTTGKQLYRLKHARFVQGMAFSRDGTLLAAGSADGAVTLWDVQTGKKARQASDPHLYFVTALHFSPDDRWLASAGADHAIKLHDVKTGALVSTFHHKDKNSTEVLAVQFSPDGKTLASATVIMGGGAEIVLWDLEGVSGSVKPKQKFVLVDGDAQYAHRDRVTSLSFSPDGRYLLSSSTDRSVKVWDLKERKVVRDGGRGRLGMCWSAKFGPRGRKILATRNHVRDGKIWLWHFHPPK